MNIIRYSVFVNSQEQIIFGNRVKITIQGGNSETLQVVFFSETSRYTLDDDDGQGS